MRAPMPPTSLERAIGPVTATLVVIGSVIGSGIFLTTGSMAEALPSPTLLMLAWATGCLLALCGALTYAELGAMFPRAGGVYVFLHEAFGPLVGFLYGWVTILVVLGGGIAAVAIGFAHYFSYFFPAFSEQRTIATVPLGPVTWTIAAHQVIAVLSIAALGAINYRGVRAGSITTAVLTVARVTGLLLLPIFAIAAATTSPSWTPVIPAGVASVTSAFGVALIAVLWTTEGYYFLTFAGGEVRDPARTVPRALTMGLLAIMAIYLTVNLAYLYALPIEQISGSPRIAEAAATALVGPSGASIIALTVLTSTFGANAAVLLGASRVAYAMASDGLFFRSTAAIHPRFRSPHVAVVGLAAWSSLLALTGTYEQLFTYVVFASVLFSVFGGLALFRLRRARPDAARPYRVWGYPWVPLLFVAGSVYLVVNTLIERPAESIAGLGLLAIGIPAYLYWRRRRAPAASAGAVE
jgi:APA family basic amino acid/polyamine antiporter